MAVESTEDDYFEYAVKKPSGAQPVPWYKSYPSAVGRAIIKGVSAAGETLSPIGFREERERDRPERERVLEENLPIGEEFGPRAIERGGKNAIQAALAPIPGGSIAGTALQNFNRGLIGGVGAEALKEIGVGEGGQTAFEIGSQLGPDLRKMFTNRLPTQSAESQRKLATEARRLKLNEQELSLAMNPQGLVNDALMFTSAKGGRSGRRIDATRKALGRVWDNLRGSPEAQKSLTSPQAVELEKSITERLNKLPHEQRKLVEKDYSELLKSKKTGDDVINFWQDINYHIDKGERGLGILKDDLLPSLKKISPELAKDFEITNNLYGNFSKLSKRLKPTLGEHLVKAGEAGAMIHGIISGNYPLLASALGTVAARQLATEMTTNPRFMNLSSKFINSLQRGSPTIAHKAYWQLIKEVGKTNEEAALKMIGMDFDQFFESLPEDEKEE